MCVAVGGDVGSGIGRGTVAMTMTVLGSYESEVEIELGVEVGELVRAGGARTKVGSGTSSLASAIRILVGNAAAEANATITKKMKAILSAGIENRRFGFIAKSRD